VKLCDRLPPGSMFVAGSKGVRHSGRLACWTIRTLAANRSMTVWVRAETLLGVTGTLRDAATTAVTAGGRRLSARANAQVLVFSGLCGSASDAPVVRTFGGPLAVAAC
jgi:hypothetical protein